MAGATLLDPKLAAADEVRRHLDESSIAFAHGDDVLAVQVWVNPTRALKKQRKVHLNELHQRLLLQDLINKELTERLAKADEEKRPKSATNTI